MKYLGALAAGLVVTLGLFYFMSTLIQTGRVELQKNGDSGFIDFVRVKRDSNTNLRKRALPKKPPPPKKAPPVPKTMVADNQDDAPAPDQPDIQMPQMDLGIVGGGGPTLARGGGGRRDGEEVPLVRIEPRYPIKARMKGIEGYVIVEFSIGPTGSPEDVEILESRPPRVFDREARKAVLKWKYKPKMIDGKAVKSRRITVNFPFTLEDEE